MSSSSSQGEFHSFPHGKDSPQTVRTSSQLLKHCPLPSAKDVSNPVCPSEPQFSSTVSRTSSSLIFPHNHQSSFGLVTCALFLSLLHPHTKADRSGRTHYTRHAPLAFHRVGLFRSDCAEERSWPLATSPRPRRGAGGGCRQPSRVGTVHREPGAEGAQKHAPACPPLGPEGGMASAGSEWRPSTF